MTSTHDLSPTDILTFVLDLATASLAIEYAGVRCLIATVAVRAASWSSFADNLINARRVQVASSGGYAPSSDAGFDDPHQSGEAITSREVCLTAEAKRDVGEKPSVSAITLADQLSETNNQDGAE